jgi:hypothetical protein
MEKIADAQQAKQFRVNSKIICGCEFAQKVRNLSVEAADIQE